MIIKNPVITGFNPDPCIIRVKDTFYVATSTFEWFPGVQLYTSKDLANWEQLPHPVNRTTQLHMKGVDASGGVWAPNLTYSDGVFYLIYSNVKNTKSGGIFRDFDNYLITSTDIHKGNWSEPIYINSSGFDHSLYHDSNGKKYIVNTTWDYRYFYNNKKYSLLRGIIIQEYCMNKQQLIGEPVEIFKGTNLGIVEAPHIYKKNEFYYLVTAEGGTSYNHAVTVARSRNLFGPYEVHPENPILTSKDNWALQLQKSGHASFVDDKDGNWYMAHLCARPIGAVMGIKEYSKEERNLSCILGRETAIQKLIWKNDWPYLDSENNNPLQELEVPFSGIQKDIFNNYKTSFQDGLPLDFSTLRTPYPKDIMYFSKNGMHLTGQESPVSKFHQSIVGFRQKHFCFESTVNLSFNPTEYTQMAGMMYRYDEENFYYLFKYYNNEEQSHYLNLMIMDNQKAVFPLKDGIKINSKTLVLKLRVEYDLLTMHYHDEDWMQVPGEYDATKISDEHSNNDAFTGAFIALGVHDLTNNKAAALFSNFTYKQSK